MSESHGQGRGQFPNTRWTLVREAQDQSTEALSHICEEYWFPLYGYARRLGHDPTDAQDLTQDFFLHLLSTDFLAQVAPERGRLRSFLLTSFRNHATATWRRENRQKRGGGAPRISFDAEGAEERILPDLSSSAGESPEIAFDRLWARELMERARRAVETAYRSEGKAALYEAFGDQLITGETDRSYRDIGTELGMDEATARYAAYSLRARFRVALQQEVQETVGDREEAEEEFAYLQRVFRTSS